MVENLTELHEESEESILCTLSNRFSNKRIYTQFGDNLIFLNPNELLPIYDESVIDLYSQNNGRRQYRRKSIAHIYAVAGKALQNIENGSRHESLIFCGESGSGKTTNLFHSLRFLCSNENSRIKVAQVNALQRICESFGGAKTIKNKSSTRFGYIADLTFKNGLVNGFSISTAVPLELSRLVTQRKGDFNFGILYQLCAGFNADQRDKYGIKQPGNYFYLNQGKCNVNLADEERKFKQVSEALSTIGFSADQKALIFSVLSAVLHVGNIFFYTQKTINNEEYAEIANENVLQWVAYLLSIDYEILKSIFSSNASKEKKNNMSVSDEANKSETSSQNQLKSVDVALDLRDALAKVLYEELFAWILSRISLFFQSSDAHNSQHHQQGNDTNAGGVISLFDMFGFEKYNNNSYEEFCVNAANEKLEQFYLRKTFAPLIDAARRTNEADKRDEYDNGREEEAKLSFSPPSQLSNNRRIVDVLMKRPSGVIPLLDDECKFPKGTDETLFQHCNLNHYDKNIYTKPRVKDRLEFGLRHSVGTVHYNLEGFLARNRWRRPAEISRVLRASKDALLVFVFCGTQTRHSENHTSLEEEQEESGENLVYIVSQLCQKLNVVLEKLSRSNCFFVRCIRSNSERQPNKFDFGNVQRHIRTLCVLDACQMLRHAYVHRFSFEAFADEMRCLLPDEVTRGKTALETTRAVLDTQGADGIAEARLNDAYILLKEHLWRQLQELKEFTRNVAALILQRNFRKWLAVHWFAKRRKAAIRLQMGYRAWKARKTVAEKRRKILENIRIQNDVFKTRIGFDGEKPTAKYMEKGEIYAEFPDLLRDQLKADERIRLCEERNENVRQVTQYLPIKSTTPRPIVSAMTIEAFAEQNLKHHVLGARREPIFAPFLPKASEQEFEDSVNIFKLILCYMNNTSLSTNQLSILAKFIIQKGIDELSQRDEIYVQLCNQTYRNCSEASATRAWNLLLMAVNAFPPGILVFPMLYSYFQSVKPSGLSSLLVNGLTRPLVASSPATKSRLFASSRFEQTALIRRQSSVLNARFCNGESFPVEADAWTTVKEFTQRVLRHKGIGDSAGWCLELCGDGETTQIAEGQYLFDAVAQFEVPNVRGETGATNPFVFNNVINTGSTASWKKPQNYSYARNNNETPIKTNWNGYSNGYASNSPLYKSPEKHAKNSYGDLDNNYGSPTTNLNGSLYKDEDSFDSSVNELPKLRRFDLRFSPVKGTSESDSSYAFSRRQNPNCMSRITEEEFALEGMRDGSLTRNHPYVHNQHMHNNNLSETNSNNNNGVDNNYNDNNNVRKEPLKDYSTMSIASRIRNMSVPTGNGDVDKFLDDVFDKALPPADYDLSCHDERKAQRALVDKIAASIRGGLRNGDEFNYFENSEADDKRSYGVCSPPLRSPLSSGLTSPIAPSHNDYGHRADSSYYQQNVLNGNYSGTPNLSNNSSTSATGRQVIYNGQNYYKPNAQVNNSNEYYRTRYNFPSPHQEVAENCSLLNDSNRGKDAECLYDERSLPNSSVGRPCGAANDNGQFSMSPNSSAKNEKKEQNGGLRRCRPLFNNGEYSSSYRDSSKDDKDLYGLAGPPSIYSTTTLANNNALGRQNSLDPNVSVSPLRRSITNNHNNIYGNDENDGMNEDTESHIYVGFLPDDIVDEFINDWVHEAELSCTDTVASRYNHSRCKSKDSSISKRKFADGVAHAQMVPVLKSRPAVEFLREPFTITVRKEIFAVDEELDDGVEIDLLFAQIIFDCRRNIPLRIRKYERETINQILRSHKVRPSLLDRLSEIATKVKIQVIDAARKWPLYFCRFYPIIEERPNDRIPLLLGISETGIRLVSYNNPDVNNQSQYDTAAVIQDHFEYSDISELVIENQKSLRLITRQSISVLVTSIHANVIKKCIEQYISGTVMNKQFVVANSDYCTNEANLLSFERGEFIQLMSGPDTECPVSGNWLYGKLANRFGWFPADYVESIPEDQYEDNCQQFQKAHVAQPASTLSNLDQLYADSRTDNINNGNGATEELYSSGLAENESERFTMAEFAVRFFRRPKNMGSSDSFSIPRKKKDWTWKDITDKVKFVDHPITHSLLRLESAEANKLAVDAFLCVMRYMGDENLKRSQTYTDCVYELLSICHRYVPLRDEVYCQMLKQLTANRSTRQSSEESQVRGWRLLSIITAYFCCSSTLKPYLVKYLSDIAYDNRRIFHGIAKQCLHHLAQSFRYGGRRFILSAAEVEATTNGKNVRRQVYHLPGGHRRVIYTRAVTVVEQIMQELCLEMNVRSAEEQEEFSLCYILEKDNTMKTLNNDEYVLDVVTELEARDATTEYILILTRSVWIHPLRQDSHLYTDALFFQIMPNYIAGLLTSLCNGNVTAATLSDVTHLGALLLLSDPLSNCVDEISASSIASLVPKTILRYGTLTPEKWAERIRAQVHKVVRSIGEAGKSFALNKYTPIRARQEFLEVVSKWSLFGAAFFFVQRAITKRQNIMECVVAINKDGVRILTNETHECLAHYTLNEIETTNKYSVSESHFIELRFTQSAAQKYGYEVFTIETNLGLEIARVVGQYLYLSNGGHGSNEPIYILNESEDSAQLK